ncbi:MAG: HDIG domain-containing protein [Bacteroidaceae bacterium]|nr:HDIG domain-containing protein [Bacteroidaceae bacterium]
MDKTKKATLSGRRLLLILSAFSALLIVYFLPKKHIERFSYTVGKPWTYDVLIAPFNFSVEKSDKVWQEEADSIARTFSPYFVRMSGVRDKALSDFDNFYYDSLYRVISPDSYKVLRSTLSSVYDAGIIQVSDEEQTHGKGYIRIYSGNSSVLTPVSAVFTARDAYKKVSETEIMAYDKYALLQHHIEEFIRPNLSYDAQRSVEELETLQNQISHYKGMVVADQKIIDQGEIVNEEKSQIIESYLAKVNEKVASRRFMLLTWGGQALFVVLVLLSLSVYLILYRNDHIDTSTKLLFLYSSVTIFTVGVSLYLQYTSWSVFIIPCSMLAIMLRIFLDSRTAFIGYFAFVVITSLVAPLPYEYLVLQFMAGITGIYSLKELSQRSQIIRTCLLIFISYTVIWSAIQMTRLENISDIDFSVFLFFAINCILLLLVYPLLFVLEKIFGFTSNVTLIELSNFNNPLLRELAERAPGTFQHSIQVSALAAEAATRLHAGSQLVRTAALYHDIGKLANPPFFTENQSGVNPHDKLTPEESAAIITSHVREGLALADKYSLPSAIKEFIATHHGNGVARYFYLKYQKEHPDEDVDIEPFSYPGPNPRSKETALLMMADAVEAASRSLNDYSEESIGLLVEKIIDTQIEEGYFRESDLSWMEVQKVKEVFKEKLRIMYHTRIKYPEATVDLHQKRV